MAQWVAAPWGGVIALLSVPTLCPPDLGMTASGLQEAGDKDTGDKDDPTSPTLSVPSNQTLWDSTNSTNSGLSTGPSPGEGGSALVAQLCRLRTETDR